MRINLTALIITIGFLMSGIKSYSQITIHEKATNVQKIFKLIEQQSKFTFLYDSQDIKGIPKVTVSIDNGSIQDVLNKVFKPLPLTYKIIAQTILVKKETQKAENADQNVPAQKKIAILLQGKVVDENGLPIKDVAIKETKLGNETLSNANGEFKIQGGSSGYITLSTPGYSKKTVGYSDSTYLEIVMKKGNYQTIDLEEVKILSNDVKENPTKFIDLENRSYMNLSQVLQGTIPGLSLQVVNSSTKTVTSVDAYVYRDGNIPVNAFRRFSVEDFLIYKGQREGQNIIDVLLKGTNVPKSISDFYHINTITTVSNSLVPEIRGANNFGSGTSNMLVVIDGFPQDGFPANYPMTNVESIEVIKDPKELIKWGSKAAGGAILIKSKSAKAGKLQINYSGSFYYSPAPKFNREKLKLANTRTYLDYLRDIDSTLTNSYGSTQFGLSPAKQLLGQKRLGTISEEKFNTQWDSLSGLNNDSQLNMLQQDAFNQTHSLTVSGGSQAYKYTAIGNYTGGQGNDLGGKNRTYSFSLNNSFKLLKNKLHIRWLINYSDAKTKSGYNFSPTNVGLDPYQMLVDGQGNYDYDYTKLSATGNQLIESRGYKNYGVNLLEDARVNNISNKVINKQSNFNMNWNLLPGLTWASAMVYTHKDNTASSLYGAESSYTRQLVDKYGQLGTNGVNFYLPYGDILNSSNSAYDNWNVRSGLSYSKTIGKHTFNLGIGGAASSVSTSSPSNYILYGYNQKTKTSTPVYLPTSPSTQSTINNFYSLFTGSSSSEYPYSLTQRQGGDTSLTRNLNGNASLEYRFSDRIRATGSYIANLSPLYGQSAIYSVQSSYQSDVTGRVVKNWNGFLKDVFLSVGNQGIQMPNLPAQYSNTRYLQSYFNNYTIWVNGTTPTQQQGQSSKNLYEKLTLAFADSTFVAYGAFNTQKTKGDLSTTNSNSSIPDKVVTSKYLSTGVAMFLRKKLLNLRLNYDKSPEGNAQYNGSFNYYLSRESFFKSKIISTLEFNATLQEISPYQGLSLMQSTNIATDGSYSQAINNDFTALPAANRTFEAHGKIGISNNKYNLDLRYYDQTSSGLSNNLNVLTDPSTGLSNHVSYSSITNRGVEFFLNADLIKNDNFSYSITINGAHNTNIARSVPVTNFTATSDYTVALRDGYDVSNIWAPKWAGLNSSGDPQIYDKNGEITSTLDSATVAGALVKQGVTKAPWTGGLIQEFRLHQFFARAALTFNLGYVMRYYRPYPGSDVENSSLVADRWQKPGDEKFTDVPRISESGTNSYREFVTRYSSNSILSADNIRLQEVMMGFNVPNKYLKKYGLSFMVVTVQVQNIAFWARNKYHIDPATISADGRIGNPLPRIYSCNISVNF
ncbi:SusC/RagA family TonB-linked outer membrane protein [Mucilaginibacter psychrotolerans]|uniref:SusC/RagA family TonB-linked outer membrane protein n=1 Tax=Mucilaginibacter psychrotolerans TaxID=1524096 RepID=A0A4Y8SJ77_9SPHI|nr:SusC/RagA family TonB-linked outer membrane protein [Mucilaginibacter psychrotolerans]TFF38494.1 SusC/RagA family TonB-linked outer membrane protein [Mucilaginibacter psychrotolerans]